MMQMFTMGDRSNMVEELKNTILQLRSAVLPTSEEIAERRFILKEVTPFINECVELLSSIEEAVVLWKIVGSSATKTFYKGNKDVDISVMIFNTTQTHTRLLEKFSSVCINVLDSNFPDLKKELQMSLNTKHSHWPRLRISTVFQSMPWRIDIGIEKKPPLLWGDYVDLFPEYFLENNKIDLDVVRVLKWLNKSMGSSGNTGWIVDVVCTKFSTVEELLEHVLFEKYEHFPDPVAKYRDLAPSLNIFRQALVNYFLQKGTV